MKRHSLTALFLALGFAALLTTDGPAQSVPSLINYQGKLTDAAGNPLPNGTYGVAFRIWNKKNGAEAGNQLIWGQEYSVATVNGTFNVILGSSAGLPVIGAQTSDLGAAFTESERYFGLTITRNPDASPVGNPQEITPRQRILSAPYAVMSVYSAHSLTSDYATHARNSDNATHAAVADQSLSSPGTERVGLVIENSPTNLTKAVNVTASLLDVQGVCATNLDLTIDLATSGLNGLDVGAALASRWYYVWVLYSAASNNSAGLFSASATAPVLPASYTRRRLVGAFRTDTNSNIVRFCQIDNRVVYDELIVKATSTGNAWTDLSLSDVVPPFARLVHINAMNSAGMYPSTGDVEAYVRAKGSASTIGSYYARGRGGAQTTTGCVVTDRNQVIQYKVTTNGSGGTLTLYVAGYTVSL